MQKNVANPCSRITNHRNHWTRMFSSLPVLLQLNPNLPSLDGMDHIQLVHDSHVLPFLYHSGHLSPYPLYWHVKYFYIKGFNMTKYLLKTLLSLPFISYYSWFITLLQFISVISVIKISSIILKEINRCFLPLTEEIMHLKSRKVEIINVSIKADKDLIIMTVDILEGKE